MASVTITRREFSRGEIMSLYKQCLTLMRVFPSIKRDALYEDIRTEFREKASLTDPEEIAHAVEVAMRGIATMQKYSGSDAQSGEWVLNLESDPLGQELYERKKREREDEIKRKLESGEVQPEDLVEPEVDMDDVLRRIDEWAAEQDRLQEEEGDILVLRHDDDDVYNDRRS